MARRSDDLVVVVCTHGPTPKPLGRILKGATIWHPSCRDKRRVMRPHHAKP